MTRDLKRALALLPDFASIPITRRDALRAIRAFEGLSYDSSFVCVEEGENGALRGKTNCYGLFFLWAQRLGLLPRNFFESLNLAFALGGVAPVLRFYLEAQTQAACFDERIPGDWLLFRWRESGPKDADEETAMLKTQHHVALFCDVEPAPLGSIFHAVDTDADGDGQIYHAPLMPHDAGQIVRVARLRQFVD